MHRLPAMHLTIGELWVHIGPRMIEPPVHRKIGRFFLLCL
jgi:hypothetical protein